MTIKVGDIVTCKVLSIESASVQVETLGGEKGAIVMSEVAAGRIRNLREYAFVNKQIICKVIGTNKEHLELSLRRVTGKEREEAQEQAKKERTLKTMLKSITKNTEIIIAKILKTSPLHEFFDTIKANHETIRPFVTKEEAEKIIAALSAKDESIKKVQTIITLGTHAEQGVEDIKKLLSKKEATITYLGSGKFSVSVGESDFKKARHKLEKILTTIGQEAKEKKISCTVKELA
jgi:translation initiation factor 2 alpha subunit (eIF-2alpha)